MDIKITIAVLLVALGGRNGGCAGSTTQARTCKSGTCTGPDETCLKNITTTCPFAGSCTKAVTKSSKQMTVTVGCGTSSTCPTTTTATTTATTTTTTTAKAATTGAPGRKRRASPPPTDCCYSPLCNQYQAPDSAAFRLQTNVLYFVGLVMLIILLK